MKHKMKNGWNDLLLSITFVIIGFFFFFYKEHMTGIVSILIGCSILFYGITVLFHDLKQESHSLSHLFKIIIDISMIVISIFIFIKKDLVMELFSVILGIFLMC